MLRLFFKRAMKRDESRFHRFFMCYIFLMCFFNKQQIRLDPHETNEWKTM